MVFFTLISAALTQAATLSPTGANPVLIMIFPGTYTENLTLVSNVHMVGSTRRDVILTGNMTWTAGVGVNAPNIAGREDVDMAFLFFTGSFAIDTTAKTGSVGVLDARDCSMRGGGTFLARPGQVDHFQLYNGQTLSGLWTFNNCNVFIVVGTSDALTFTGNCAIDVRATEIFNDVNASGSSTGSIEGTQINGNVNINAGCSVDFTGSRLMPGFTLTVAAGGSADFRMAEYGSLAQLAGAGTIDRSIWRTTVAGTAIGANVVAVAPPLPNAAYNVAITQTAGPTGVPPLITAKAGGSFTLNDSVGGRTFDLTVMKE